MFAPHITTIKVRFNELDPYGHVNHAQYISYFEHGRTEALDSVGVGLSEMADKGFQIVVMDLTAAYKSAAVAGDELTIETVISQARRASTIWDQRITKPGADGEPELVATITIRGGITDTTGKPTRPPSWLFEQMAPIIVPAAD